MTKKNIAVFYSAVDKPGRHDAAGAFIPEARAFQLVHGISDYNMIGVDCLKLRATKRRKIVSEALYCLGRNQPLDAIAFFGRGWPNGIQFGFSKKHTDELAHYIQISSRPTVSISLYTGLTAENDVRDRQVHSLSPATKGGFVDRLARCLWAEGCSGYVDTHKTAAHTTWNPYVVRFYFNIPDGPAWLVEPGSYYWAKWVKAMCGTNLRFDFPFLSELEIKQQLDTGIIIE